MSVSCLRACMNTVYMPEAQRGQKRASVVLDVELRKLWTMKWMLGTEPWSSLKQQVSLITEPTLKTLGSLWRLQYFHWFFENFILSPHCDLLIFVPHNLSPIPYFLLPTSYWAWEVLRHTSQWVWRSIPWLDLPDAFLLIRLGGSYGARCHS